MTIYVNPTHGNDATAIPDSRARPFKTHPAALAFIEKLPAGTAFRLVETHKTLPVDPE